MEINNIYKVQYMKDRFAFIGTFRNAKKFNINDSVWFSQSKYDGRIFRGRITGVELPPDDNPEYRYKITIPENIVTNGDFSATEFKNVICDSIFSTIKEAKASAEANLQHMYRLQLQEIETYFKQFETK